MANIKTLITDIYELFNPEKHHVVNEDNLNVFLKDLGDVIRRRLAEREVMKPELRFSNLGKTDRQLWFTAHGYETEKMSAKTYFKFLYGDIIEALLLFLAKEAGHEVTDEQKEVEVLGVKGHIDAKIDGVVVDVKSASPFGFQKFRDHSLLHKDPFGYIQQLSGYVHCETPGEVGAFLACNKVSADLTLMEVSPSVSNDYDPYDRITHLQGVIDSAEPPPRCYEDIADGKSGNRKLGTECSYCSFKQHCWPNLRTFIYSTGPRFLTQVARQPDVPEIKGDIEVDEG
ncbi:hypothetical protein KGP36_03155 [Patescibacteria group bacterium]|nr:hypothetical protein [Patescibacteria group bacterium]